MYGMEHFMDKDVVMVSINYRLAIMGGLYLDKDNVPGNQGLRDQILALQWVQENIGQFGGGALSSGHIPHLAMVSLHPVLFPRASVQPSLSHPVNIKR